MALYSRLTHPVASLLPTGLWIASTVFDLLYLQTQTPSYATASHDSILLGLILTVALAPLGIRELLTHPSALLSPRTMGKYLALNWMAASIFVISFFVRIQSLQNALIFSIAGLCFALASALVSYPLLMTPGEVRPSGDSSVPQRRTAA